jgi:hypothetical protein
MLRGIRGAAEVQAISGAPFGKEFHLRGGCFTYEGKREASASLF